MNIYFLAGNRSSPRMVMTYLCIAFFIAACSNQPGLQGHPEWTDSLNEKIESMKQTAPARIIPYLDSVYGSTPGRGIADIWIKYKIKSNYYGYVGRDENRRWQYLDSMEQLLRGQENRFPHEYAQTLNEKGRAFTDEKKYNEGFDAYYDGLQFALRQKDSCALADFNTSMAMIVYARQEYQKAIAFLQPAYLQGLHCSAHANNFNKGFVLPQGILNTLGLCYEKIGKIDSATYYYEEGLQLVQEAYKQWPANKSFIMLAGAVIEGNLGSVMAKQGQYDKAEHYLRNSILVNDRDGFDRQDAHTAKAKLIDLYLREKRYADADHLLSELYQGLLLKIGKEDARMRIWINWYRLKARLLDSTGQYREAFQFFQRSGELSDSMIVLQSALYKANMETTFNDRSNQYARQLLEKDTELKSIYLVASIIIGVTLLVFVLIVWINLKRTMFKNIELARINEQKRTFIKALLESEKRHAHMTKLVAHDLRGPIGAIASIASLAEDEKGGHFSGRELWNMVKVSADKSLKLAQELLEQPDLHKKEKIDLAALLAYSVDLLQHQLQEKMQKVQLNAKPVIVELHQDSFWRVIVNLLSNASKFSGRGTTITVSLQVDEGGVLISVQDEGIGIPQQLQPFVFDGLESLRRPGTAGESSFGLGLAGCKKIVQRQGGDIWVESQEGSGTTFYIHLFVETNN